MVADCTKIHPKFTLNGISYSRVGLRKRGNELALKPIAHEAYIGRFLIDWLSDAPRVPVNTSGSTGKPKKIFLKKQHMVNSAKATGIFFNLNEGTRALLCLPVNFIAGKMMLVRAMVLGWELDYVAPSTIPLSHTQGTYNFSAMIPLQLENSLDKIGQVEQLIVGGAPISGILKKQLQSIKTQIFETYGMTETITHIAVKKINPSDPNSVENAFTTLPDIAISMDERNCLIIKAPKIVEHSVLTNDVVRILSDTKFQWLGRYDTIINSGGIKLIPEQIELKLDRILNTRFFVAGIPDDSLGHKLILIVEGTIDKEGLLQTLKSNGLLKKNEVPKEIHTIEKFMETKNGKVQRVETLKKLHLYHP